MMKIKKMETALVLFTCAASLSILTIPNTGFCQPQPEQNTPETTDELPVIYQEDSSDNGMFESLAGYVHPFLSIDGIYSDNLYNTKEQEVDDIYTVISPGLWLSAPRSREIVVDIDASNTAPGGLATSFQPGNEYKRYQSYFLYEADIYAFSSESQNDLTDHTAEGMFQYNLPGGLSLQLVDQWKRAHDDFRLDASVDGQVQKYYDNIFQVSLQHSFSEKIRLQGNYSNYYLDFDSIDREYRNRIDNTYELFLFYNYSPKTSFFINGEYIILDFDTATENDASQYYVYGGMQWRPSPKTNIRARLGYVDKTFDDDMFEGADGFAMELIAIQHFTPKTSLQLTASSNIDLPDSNDYNYMRNNFLRLTYLQQISEKISARIGGYVGFRDYRGGNQADRDDTFYRFIPELRWELKRWVEASLGYTFEKRDSNIELLDYDTNKIFLNVTFAL